jgi:replicative DNA helicase
VTITDIKRFARSVNRRKPLAGIVVDYLQLMSPPPGDKRPRHEFVADMSRQLKILAMEMQVPVVALSQLNRGSTQREDKMPQISDLRESGAIEQDADVVILLHREIMGDTRGDLSMLVAKNRNGSTNVAELDFHGHYSMALDKGALLAHLRSA